MQLRTFTLPQLSAGSGFGPVGSQIYSQIFSICIPTYLNIDLAESCEVPKSNCESPILQFCNFLVRTSADMQLRSNMSLKRVQTAGKTDWRICSCETWFFLKLWTIKSQIAEKKLQLRICSLRRSNSFKSCGNSSFELRNRDCGHINTAKRPRRMKWH